MTHGWEAVGVREGRGNCGQGKGKRRRGRWKKRVSGREEGNRVRDRIGVKKAREGRWEEGNMGNSHNNKYFLSLTVFFSCMKSLTCTVIFNPENNPMG